MKSTAEKRAELRARIAELAAEEKAIAEAACVEAAKIFDLCGALEFPPEALAGAAIHLREASETDPAEYARLTDKGVTFLPRSLLSSEGKSRTSRGPKGAPAGQPAAVVAAAPDAATARQGNAAGGKNE